MSRNSLFGMFASKNLADETVPKSSIENYRIDRLVKKIPYKSVAPIIVTNAIEKKQIAMLLEKSRAGITAKMFLSIEDRIKNLVKKSTVQVSYPSQCQKSIEKTANLGARRKCIKQKC